MCERYNIPSSERRSVGLVENGFFKPAARIPAAQFSLS